jgi:hypothetical protein
MLNTITCAKVLKLLAGELRSIVRDDLVWYSKTHDRVSQFGDDDLGGAAIFQGVDLWPFTVSIHHH